MNESHGIMEIWNLVTLTFCGEMQVRQHAVCMDCGILRVALFSPLIHLMASYNDVREYSFEKFLPFFLAFVSFPHPTHHTYLLNNASNGRNAYYSFFGYLAEPWLYIHLLCVGLRHCILYS